MPIPNDTSSESSRRDISNADLFGNETIPIVQMSSMDNRPRGAWCDKHRLIRYTLGYYSYRDKAASEDSRDKAASGGRAALTASGFFSFGSR